jgi:hypothetical protein
MQVPGRFERKDKRPCRHIREESLGTGSGRLDKEIETMFPARETEERRLENGLIPAESRKEYENRPYLTAPVGRPGDGPQLGKVANGAAAYL